MLRRRTFVLAAAAGLLAVTGTGAGADNASELPYDFVLASVTFGDGTTMFVNARTAADGGRTNGVVRFERIGSPSFTSRVCISVQGNEAFMIGYFTNEGTRLIFFMLLIDHRRTGQPDEIDGLYPPIQGDVPKVCPPFDGFGKGLHGTPVDGDINIHDG